MTLTPSERRGALVLLTIFALGAARDLWEARPAARRAVPVDALAPRPFPDPVSPDTGDAGSLAGAGSRVPRPFAAPADPIEINRASAAELEALPGVGPVLAERIVAYRREHGPFRAAEELMAVRGVGPKSFARMRQRIRVSAADTTR